MRTTIDFGIDLGTTNSAIAVLRGTDTEIIKNNEDHDCTPSAVRIDKKGRQFVGRLAKQSLESDPENAHCEFKLQMGTSTEYAFAATGRRLKPEELSAEVLKSLKGDVQHKLGEELSAAVITVPAAFELPQCEATKRAAQLAGLGVSPLLQEPVAAALAYGFQSEADNVFWFVYDFGGGTFDAALIQVRDGVISVINHEGDNHLGGKLIDWALVDEILIPALTRERRLSGFSRANPKWRAAVQKLKLHAEEAKIRLSRDPSTTLQIDDLCKDDRGEGVDFECELRRSDVERVLEPLVFRSLNTARTVLADKRLGAGDIARLILVGGPTLTPYLRQRLGDTKEGLGITVDHSVDPLTVVARGAAVFSGTQRLEGVTPQPTAAGQYVLELEYKPAGADTDPLVGGRVVGAEGQSFAGFALEFQNPSAQPAWRSGRIGVAPNGTFMTNLHAEKGRQNVFEIQLYDATGVRRETLPDRLTYTVGMVVTDPIVIHSVGIGLANNQMRWALEKGTALPARRRVDVRTTVELRRGQTGTVVRIPVLEGVSPRADRNQRIGTLCIEARSIRRDVPVGSEVEVTVNMDASRILKAEAYVPVLDDVFEHVINYDDYDRQAENPRELSRELDQERQRLERARQKARSTGDAKAEAALQRIDTERIVHDAEAALTAADSDRDAADKCQKRLLALKAAIDEAEDALEWPSLVADAEKQIDLTRQIVNDTGFDVQAKEKEAFSRLEKELRGVMSARDPDLLRRKVEELRRVGVSVLLRQPGFWIAQLEYLEGRRHAMKSPSQAETYIAQGRRAINSNDIEGLKAAVRQLASLLPDDDPERGRIASDVI